MKKSLVCVMILLVFMSAGCRRRDAAPAAEYIGVTARLLTDASGIDDRSFNAAAWRGVLEFFGDTWDDTRHRGIAYDWVSAPTQDMFIPTLRQAADEGHDLIIAAGFTWAEAVETAAAANIEQNFLLIDVDDLTAPNVMQAVFAEHEGSFLVGAAAALKALEEGIVNPQFGFIGGMPYPVIQRFEVGFIQGILSIIPDARVRVFYVGGWEMPALARTQARNWFDDGVFAIFSAAGQSGNGTIAQAREHRRAGRNVWAIGVDSDQHDEGIYDEATGASAVLTSMIKRVESSVIYALFAVQSDNFYGRTITFDLNADGVGYSITNPAMTDDMIWRLEDIRRDIIHGRINVVSTIEEARALPGFPR